MPLDLDQEFIDLIVQNVLDSMNETTQNTFTTNELPLYPTKKQVKRFLHIGDERLNHWISNGLPVIPFGKETRFDREDIKDFLNKQKI